MYSPHGFGASEPPDRLMRGPRDVRPWWTRWLMRVVISIVVIAVIGVCAWFIALALYRPRGEGVYAIPGSHAPLVFIISIILMTG